MLIHKMDDLQMFFFFCRCWGAGEREKCDLQVFVEFTYFNISHMLRRQQSWNVFSWFHAEGSGRPPVCSSNGLVSG